MMSLKTIKVQQLRRTQTAHPTSVKEPRKPCPRALSSLIVSGCIRNGFQMSTPVRTTKDTKACENSQAIGNTKKL